MTDLSLRVPSDGIELMVETFGDGPWLIFAHGLTGNRQGSRRQMTPLADRYRIAIYDQRGHGDSTPIIDPTLYDLDRMAGDMAAVMDALGIDKAIVGGESMGAATTLRFAMCHPERVTALLLTAPAFSESANEAADQIINMGYEIRELGMDAYLRLSGERMRSRGASDEVVRIVAEMQSVHNPASLATACETCINWTLDDMDLIANLTMPACIIGWPNDLLHPLALAEQVAATLPDARMETLPALGLLFTRPAVVGEIYGRFLGEK